MRLKVENFTSIHPGSFRHVDFALRRGEILGVAGLSARRRTELFEGIYGIRAHSAGKVFIDGQEVISAAPSTPFAARIAFLRKTESKAASSPCSAWAKTSIAPIQAPEPLGKISYKKCYQVAQEGVKRFRVKAPSLKTPVRDLSGGNQQKVLLARWLAHRPGDTLPRRTHARHRRGRQV